VVEGWFTRPEEAVKVVGGLRRGRALLDRQGTFATIQARAHTFTWDAAMQARAAAYTSAQMVGWIEEVHKGLEGLRRGDIGRLLNARYGLSWGLSDVVQVHRGVLVSGDNGVWDEVAQAVGSGTEWSVVRRAAFGIEAPGGGALPLRDQVRAGLRLYVLTARLLGATLAPRDDELVAQTVRLIEQTLAP
jgi:hypothetical protein